MVVESIPQHDATDTVVSAPKGHRSWVHSGHVPFLGYGVGLRRAHFDRIFEFRAEIDFLEVLVENFMGFGGRPRHVLQRAAELWPIVFHGVGLSIGAVEPLDEAYLEPLFELMNAVRPQWFSDHLSYSSAFGVDYHDLIPLPFTEEVADHVATRVRALQERTDVPFLLENPTYYMEYDNSSLSEVDFINMVLDRSGCGLLLDVNNVYVNAQNHGYDPRAFIDRLRLDRVGQIHMAGHTPVGDILIDTHGQDVPDPVYDLYAYTLQQTGPVTTLLERDHDIPSIETLVAENARIRAAGHDVLGEVPLWTP